MGTKARCPYFWREFSLESAVTNIKVQSLFESIQEAALSGIWSKGIALSRAQTVRVVSENDDEVVCQVGSLEKPVSYRVQLFLDDEDYYCDCDEKKPPCQHAVAAIAAVKNKTYLSAESGGVQQTAQKKARVVRYQFQKQKDTGALQILRFLEVGDSQEVLSQSLVSLAGGLRSGRVAGPELLATKTDYAIDGLWNGFPGSLIPTPEVCVRLLTLFEDCDTLVFDSTPIRSSGRVVRPHIKILRRGENYVWELQKNDDVQEVFSNFAVLQKGILHPLSQAVLPEPRIYTFEAMAEALHELRSQVEIDFTEAQELEHPEKGVPEISFQSHPLGEGTLVVTARVVYKNSSGRFLKNQFREEELKRDLFQRWRLRVGEPMKLVAERAREFLKFAHGEFSEIVVQWNGIEPRFETSDSRQAHPDKVLEAIAAGSDLVPLHDGTWAKLPEGWLQKYGSQIALLLNARQKNEHGEMPSAMAPLAVKLMHEMGSARSDVKEAFMPLLGHFESLPQVTHPKGFQAVLRPYQELGVRWLYFLKERKLGALLADDMGLGKTIQVIVALPQRSLVVAPTSVLASWKNQIEKFRPNLRICVYHGSHRKLDSSADVVLTSYGILRQDETALTEKSWAAAIIDESQTIKNFESQTAQSVMKLKADFRVALSGTPVENRLDDLWSQFQFLNAGLLGSKNRFIETSATDIRALTKPFILRRLKKDVAQDLPPRTEVILECEFSESEEALYQSVFAATKKEVLEKLEAGEGVFSALEALLRLRQACCHPLLIPGAEFSRDVRSSKIEVLVKELLCAREQGHRSLVFSQWTSFLDLIEKELTDEGISFSRLDGATQNRAAVVSQFQNADGPSVMLLSLKAGGVGLTLTAADHVFICDPWWNPAVEDQAADRAHRIGQTNPVEIHRLVVKETIEERILQLQKKKKELAASVLDDESIQKQNQAFTRDDILELLNVLR